MANIKIGNLESEISVYLNGYNEEVINIVNDISETAVKNLVKKTKATAPQRTGKYAKAITSTKELFKTTGEIKFIWGVKAPYGRLTHLLVNGHQTRNGGRTSGNKFLENALEEVATDYEAELKRRLGNG